nr:MAG TPA: hypothetical protein [Caudoviricetes sp.]
MQLRLEFGEKPVGKRNDINADLASGKSRTLHTRTLLKETPTNSRGRKRKKTPRKHGQKQKPAESAAEATTNPSHVIGQTRHMRTIHTIDITRRGINAGRKNRLIANLLPTPMGNSQRTQRIQRVLQLQQQHFRLAETKPPQLQPFDTVGTATGTIMLQQPRTPLRIGNGLQTIQQVAKKIRIIRMNVSRKIQPVETTEIGDDPYSAV